MIKFGIHSFFLWFILIFFLFGQEELFIRNTSVANATLAIPRTKMVINPRDLNEIWFIAGVEDANNVFFTKDQGKTWGSFSTIAMDYHCQLRMDSLINLHITAPGRNNQIYFNIKYPADNSNLMGPVEDLRSGPTSNNYRGTILVENNNVWVFTRLTNNPDQNVRFHLSTDLGQTWPVTGFIPTLANEIRIGSILFHNTPTLIVYFMFTEFRYYQWNGKTFVAYNDSTIAKESAEKIFTFNTFKDGNELHLIFQPKTNSDILIHKWKNFDYGQTTNWNTEIIPIGSTVFRSSPYLVRSDNALFLFYTSGDGQIYLRIWDGKVWSSASQITHNNDTNLYSNSVEYIYPTMDFIPLIWTKANGSIWFKKINLNILDLNQPQTVPNDYFVININPNPFNGMVNIRLTFNHAERVRLSIYNVQGKRLGDIFNGIISPGKTVLKINPEEVNGMKTSGIYFLSLQTKNKAKIYKILYIK